MHACRRVWVLGAAVLALVLAAHPSRADQPVWRWYEVDAEKNVKIHAYVFYSATCRQCTRALEFTRSLEKRYPWLRVHYYEISYPPNLDYYRDRAASMGRAAGQVPAIFYCNQLDIGFDSAETAGARIERLLVRWYETLDRHYHKRGSLHRPADLGRAVSLAVTLVAAPDEEEPPDLPPGLLPEPEEEPSVRVPFWGELEAGSLSLPALTVVLAGCDAFNPCAFFVLLFLLSLLLHAHSRWRMWLIGSVFIFFSGLVYFLFMAAWLNLFFVVGHLRVITLTAGVVAVAAALLNVKDFFWFKQGVSLSIPESVKPGLFQRMTRLIRQTSLARALLATAVLAALVNLYELLCTSGFPMVYTRVLTLRQLPTSSYYLYLVLYNAVYVLPLALIVLVFSLTLGGHKLTEYEGRALKLTSGTMMLILGLVLVFAPDALNTVAGALGALGGAVLLSGVILAAEHHWKGRKETLHPTAG